MPEIRFDVVVDRTELELARREAKQVERALLALGDTSTARELLTSRRGLRTSQELQDLNKLQRELSDLENLYQKVKDARDRVAAAGGSRVQASRLGIPPDLLELAAGTARPRFGQINLDQASDLLALIQGRAAGISDSIREWTESGLSFESQVAALENKLQDLAAAFERVAAARERSAGLGGTRVQASQLDIPSDILQRVVGTDRPQFGQISLRQARDVLVELRAEGQRVANQIANWSAGLREVTQQYAIQASALGEVRREVQAIAEGEDRQRVERAASGQALEVAVRERINRLESNRNRLIERRAALEEGILNAVGGRTAIDIQRQILSLREQEANAIRRINGLLERRQVVEETLAKAGRRSVEAFVQRAEAAREAGTPIPTVEIDESISVKEQEALEVFIDLTNQLVEAQSKLAAIRRQSASPEGSFDAIAQLIGQDENLRNVTDEIRALDEQIGLLAGPRRAEQIDLIAPGLLERMARLRQVMADIETIRQGGTLTRTSRFGETIIPDQTRTLDNLIKLRDQLFENIQSQQADLAEVDLLPTADDIIARLPALERTLINAFRGFGRRFQATLQFALSGALIFSLQQFARQAFETAIQVERAFADIATALEFDIPFDRQSAQFRSALEDIRVGILQIADEFNVLPTVANEIAFAMVSRFRDVDNALIATRAQLLALKVSTIDADEIIRALTATSEAFAAQVFEANQGLSLQERLLRREAAAARIQQQAMDLATQIQQEWGVTLEDTVEGTARSAEVFRQLGFSLEETAAIVAATSFQLGQTGVNVAERLNRSIGQLTSPQIRDQLLELAAASEEFTLTFADFENGARALDALSEQFQRLEAVDPQTAQQIAQIVGQRREIEVVSAVLGSRDLRSQITESAEQAAGAAERRFGFLRDTVTEILASIGQQFEELAQNLERLGGLSPFKVLLKSADLFLNVINEILKAVNGLLDGLRQLGPIGNFVANAIPNVVALSIAAATLLRTFRAIAQVEAVKLGTQAIGALLGVGAAATTSGRGRHIAQPAEVVSLLSVAITGASRLIQNFGRVAEGAANGLFKAVDVVRNFRIAQLTNVATTYQEIRARLALTSVLTAQQLAAVQFFGAIAKISLVIAGFIFLYQKLSESVQASTRVQEAYTETLGQLNRDTRIRSALGLISREETEIENLRNIVRAWEAAAEQTADVWATAATNVVDGATGFLQAQALRELGVSGIRDRFEAFGADNIFEQLFNFIAPTEARRSLIPGSEEAVRFERNQAIKELIQAQVEDLQEQLFEIGQELDSTGTGEFLARRLAELRAQIDAATTNEEIEAAEQAYQDFLNEHQRFLFAIGANQEALEVTLKDAERRTKELLTEVEFGRLQPGAASVQFERLADDLNKAADFVSKLPLADADELEEAFRDAAIQAIRQASELITQQTEARIAIADAFQSDEGRLLTAIEEYRREIQRQSDLGQFEAVTRAQIQLVQAERELNQFYLDRLQAEARFRESLARTIEERRDILLELADELIRQAIEGFQAIVGGIDPADRKFKDVSAALDALRDALRVAEGIRREGLDLDEEIAIRRKVVDVLKGAPPLDDLARLQAELARLRALRATQGGVEAAETTLEINRVIAQINEELLRRAGAAALLLAGVNDSIKSLQAQISINIREIELAANSYGRQSTQYLQLKLKQEQLKQELANALLELRDLNRRLDSDITNSFEQAQLDLVAVLEKLAAPDLGELERARLELERKNAEAAAQREFFDDRLFQLRFAFETGDIGTGAYISALRALQDQVDTTTQQGREIFLQIQGIIDGLTNDVSNLAFNIPESIRLPTIFEIRRALAADQLGVNYQDNRVQTITIDVNDSLDLQTVIDAIDSAFGAGSARLAPGGAGVTIGGF